MNRPNTLFAQSLVDLGSIALVHHLPDLISLWPYADRVMIQVHADQLEGYRSALRGAPLTTESRATNERVSTAATLPHGGDVEVYAYRADA